MSTTGSLVEKLRDAANQAGHYGAWSGAEGGHQNRAFLLTYRRHWDKFLTLKITNELKL